MSTKVVKIDSESIEFDNGLILSSNHDQDCCENHYLDFSGLTLEDFQGLEFDLSTANFFERVEDYGIRLKPLTNFPVSVPGYGYNNGYYSSNLTLTLSDGRTWEISECQEIHD